MMHWYPQAHTPSTSPHPPLAAQCLCSAVSGQLISCASLPVPVFPVWKMITCLRHSQKGIRSDLWSGSFLVRSKMLEQTKNDFKTLTGQENGFSYYTNHKPFLFKNASPQEKTKSLCMQTSFHLACNLLTSRAVHLLPGND